MATEPAAGKKVEKQEHSFTADQLNWDQRVRSELESARKWNENWGTLFVGGIPNDEAERVQYLEEELKKTHSSTANVKYGLGPAFKEVGLKDFKRKKMFQEKFDLDDF